MTHITFDPSKFGKATLKTFKQLVTNHVVNPSKPDVLVDTGRLQQSVQLYEAKLGQDGLPEAKVVFGSADGKTYRPSVRNDFRGAIEVDYAQYRANLERITEIYRQLDHSI